MPVCKKPSYVLRIVMHFLKFRHKSRLVFDSFYLYRDHSNFWECKWKDFYEGAVEAIPLNAILLRRKEVELHIIVDSNHTGKKQ